MTEYVAEKKMLVYCRNTILYAEFREILAEAAVKVLYEKKRPGAAELEAASVLLMDGPAAEEEIFEMRKRLKCPPAVIVLRTDTDAPKRHFRKMGANACLDLKDLTVPMLRQLAESYARENRGR